MSRSNHVFSESHLDVTIGDGGHTEAILRASAPQGRVVGMDRGPEALARAARRLRSYRERLTLVQGEFSTAPAVLREEGVDGVDGIVADLGVSSRQLDLATRGFSIKHPGPLDMRMNPDDHTTAATLVNEASETDLARWFAQYGEERYARRIARAICRYREEHQFVRTDELVKLIKSVVPLGRKGKIDPATRSFQALRIVVNDELSELDRFLAVAPWLLNPNGCCAVISYHSLEDRRVKNSFRQIAAREDRFVMVTGKPIVPEELEIKRNPRSRSAKLRVVRRVAV